MARPSKINILSFPFDVDFFDNKFLVRINGEFGAKGMIIVVKLLCAVYQQGYFLKWSDDEQYLMKRYLSGISVELIDQVLQRLLKWGFFDNDLFKSAEILTSVEIQRNFFNAIRRRTGIDRASFPYLLLDPEHPNNVSAYRKGINVCNNNVSVDNNSDNVDNNEVYVIKNPNSCNKNSIHPDDKLALNVAEKEFLHTKTGVSVNNNSENVDNNSDNVDKNKDLCNKNPIEAHFAAQKEFLHTKTGVSVTNNSDSCIQKQMVPKNNNSENVDNNEVSVYNNSDNVDKNGKTDNRNSNSYSNNPTNIIYNYNNSSSNSRSSCSNKKSEQKIEIGEQKGKESYQSFDESLKELKGMTLWRESVCKNNKINNPELDRLLDKFSIHCKAEGKTNHSSMQELMSHFNRWIPYSGFNSQNLTKQHYGNNERKSDARDKRRGTPANCQTEKDYHSTF